MKGGTLFSGIGAPELAMPWVDWRWCAEIDPFASAVHAARFPGVPNLGDVTRIDPDGIEPVDLIVFGSPCQSFSVAGKRLGLDDPRGNLALVALALVERLRPRWFLFENVPGLLSSADGRDFGLFLRAVEDIGYLGCWRVLDAQFAGVPQRRRRVFFVGHPGDWRPAAAVLLERESLSGHPAPRREAGAGIADGTISRALTSSHTATGRLDPNESTFIPVAYRTSPNCGAWKTGDRTDALTTGTDPNATVLAFDMRGQEGGAQFEGPHDTANIRATNGGSSRSYVAASAVRRLTPRECERLQGFPDDWTLITYRGKPAADGPRYKAIGNSMAVPVVRWIGERIRMVDALLAETRRAA